jgi:transposase
MPGNTPYCLSKGGMRMLTRTAGVELAPHNILVVGVGPGAVATPINLATMKDPALMKKLDTAIPLGRMIGVMDLDDRRVTSRRVECELTEVVKVLAPFKKRLEQVAVESTYNWYWLVDGLRALDYPVVLANPAAMGQYNGIKHADDTHDAFFVAELLRLKILPTGHIYDPVLRPVRDLLRRRLMLVHQRTALMLSFKSLYTRTTGREMTLGMLKLFKVQEAQRLYRHPANGRIAGMQIQHIEQLTESIDQIEKRVLEAAHQLPCYEPLLSLPGVGKILGMTVTMEVGEVKRFAQAGHFASYCRTVAAERTSNDKKKGQNNAQCGNKYLSWAFVEAANFARRYDPACRRWYDRKASQTSKVVATKALACKLAKAAWHLMVKGTTYEAERLFGKAPAKGKG